MIKEALEYLNDMFVDAATPKMIHEDSHYRHMLFKDGAGETVVKAFDKKVPERLHRFLTLEGFLSYLNSEHTEGTKSPIFVGEKSVCVPLRYRDVVQEIVTLNLVDSEEWVALMELQHGVLQKTLWRSLVTKLAGCVDPTLLMTIGALALTRKQGEGAIIDPFGITSTNAASETVVTFPATGGAGEQKRSIANEWTFRVRRWECFPSLYAVTTTLEMSTDGGDIRFTFHPRRLKQVEQVGRADLVAEITKTADVTRYTVHEGEL